MPAIAAGYMAVMVIGALALIGSGLRKLYKREGKAFARWHRRRLLKGLGGSVIVLGVMSGVAFVLGREVAEMSFVAALAVYDGMLIWRRLRERSIRGTPVNLGSQPEGRQSRSISALAVLGAGLLAVSVFIGESVTTMDIVRVVGVSLFALAAILGGDVGNRIYEGGIRHYRRFVRWDSIGSFRSRDFASTTVFEFQIKEPRWFLKEVSFAVPRAEAAAANAWLSKRMPRLGHDDMERIAASGAA